MTPLYKKVIEPPPAPPFGPPETHHFYPHYYLQPGATSCDGYTARAQYGVTWSNLHDLAGTYATTTIVGADVRISSWDKTGQWYLLHRLNYLFDTSSIPVGSNILEVILHLWCSTKYNTLLLDAALNIFTSSPASDIDLVPADYQQYGAVPLSTPISYADCQIGAYNDFPFNQAGLDALIAGGITKLAVRESNYDAPDNLPPWLNYKHMWMRLIQRESGDEAQWPDLEVTYEPPL